MSQLKTASVLAFERNLDISDGFFSQKNSQDPKATITPINVREKSVRGTISNRLKKAIASDATKLDAAVENANLQTVDVAALDHDKDTLIVEWSCKVLPFDGKPNVCNNQAYQKKLIEVVQTYIKEHSLHELAKRYAINIANARWLWRNRLGAEKISLTVNCTLNDKENMSITFDDAKTMSLNDFSVENSHINQLAKLIEQGLMNEAFIILYITAEARVGYGQEVYPSQELILDKGASKKSKVLYQIDHKAGLHSQKISNAIRTIDNWYDDALFPVASEPYGAVTTLGHAFRQPTQKTDFYSIFDNWILKDEKPMVDQQHYVISVLIRGGVFGESGKE